MALSTNAVDPGLHLQDDEKRVDIIEERVDMSANTLHSTDIGNTSSASVLTDTCIDLGIAEFSQSETLKKNLLFYIFLPRSSTGPRI